MKLGVLICMVLMSSVYNTYAEDSIPIKKNAEEMKTEKGFFAKLIDKVNIFADKEEVKQEIVEKPKKVNPADKFPDPLFYDAIYKKSKYQKAPLWIFNDKSSYENNHIPPIFNYKYIVDDIFPIIMDAQRTPEVILLIDAIAGRGDVDLNKQDKFGNTLLHYAIRYNNMPVFEKLLSTDAVNPNVCNYSYICPIHLSVYKQSSQEISQLVNYGSDLKYSNDRFEMPIVIAIRLHYYNVIYTLARKHKEKGVTINEIDYIIFTAKQAGIPNIADELYKFFMLDKEFED